MDKLQVQRAFERRLSCLLIMPIYRTAFVDYEYLCKFLFKITVKETEPEQWFLSSYF